MFNMQASLLFERMSKAGLETNWIIIDLLYENEVGILLSKINMYNAYEFFKFIEDYQCVL